MAAPLPNEIRHMSALHSWKALRAFTEPPATSSGNKNLEIQGEKNMSIKDTVVSAVGGVVGIFT